MLVVALLGSSVSLLVPLAVRVRVRARLNGTRLALRTLQARELRLGLAELALLRCKSVVLVLLRLSLSLQRLLRLAQGVERDVLQALLQLALNVS